jgi:hypothetical protein
MDKKGLKEIIKKEYKMETEKIISLLSDSEDTTVSERKVPAICISGKENGLLDLFLENLLEQIEGNNFLNIEFRTIYNSNDYYEIGGTEEQIKIEEIRDLITFSAYKKEKFRHKYVVIKNIEKANVFALNSLLKLIEEPTAGTVFICTSLSFSSLLNTIKSRLFNIDLPVKVNLSDFDKINSDEFVWISKLSFKVMELVLEISYSNQKSILKLLREKTVKELFDDYSMICLEDNSLTLEGVELKKIILIKLYSMCIVEKIIFSDFRVLFRDILMKSNEFIKMKSSAFDNSFFKELFFTTEKMLYSLLKIQKGCIDEHSTYTYLTVQWLSNQKKFNSVNLKSYIKFLEQIKNSTKINCNRELLFINYFLGFKNLLSRK